VLFVALIRARSEVHFYSKKGHLEYMISSLTQAFVLIFMLALSRGELGSLPIEGLLVDSVDSSSLIAANERASVVAVKKPLSSNREEDSELLADASSDVSVDLLEETSPDISSALHPMTAAAAEGGNSTTISSQTLGISALSFGTAMAISTLINNANSEDLESHINALASTGGGGSTSVPVGITNGRAEDFNDRNFPSLAPLNSKITVSITPSSRQIMEGALFVTNPIGLKTFMEFDRIDFAQDSTLPLIFFQSEGSVDIAPSSRIEQLSFFLQGTYKVGIVISESVNETSFSLTLSETPGIAAQTVTISIPRGNYTPDAPFIGVGTFEVGDL
jgi:hypothetical protein